MTSKELLRRSAALLAPPPRQTLSQWAEANFILSGEYSSKTGEFRCYEFQREILDSFTDPRAETVVVMCATQMVKSLFQQIALAYSIDKAPGPVLMVFPADDDAETFSKERIAPMLRDVACLQGKVSDARSRDSKNTITHKRFPGGFVALVGAQSPNKLARRPIRYLLCDEIDKYPLSAGSEGDPISLARKRTITFRRRKKIVLTCSPTIAGRSRIAKAYHESDQRSFWVPCPACEQPQKLLWRQVKWDHSLPMHERPATAYYECEHCKANWSDVQRWRAIERGGWRGVRSFLGTAGFQISELYSPWRTLSEIVADWLKAEKNRETLKVFVNTVLAELWEEAGETPDYEILYGRREAYPIGTVPDRALFLTAGVDVQDDRLEVELVGWGRNKESWSIDYQVIRCYDQQNQPLRTSNPEVWAELHRYLSRDWPCTDGRTIPMMAMAIDTGYRPKPVYDFAKRCAQPGYGPAGMRVGAPRTVIPVKGNNDGIRLLSAVSKENAARKRQGVRIVSVGGPVAKQELYDNLRLPRPGIGAPAPGYCHFPGYSLEYFEGLCSEKRIVHENGSVTWDKQGGARNEALDCRVYARAAAAVFGIDMFSENQWQALERQAAVKTKESDKPKTQMPPPPARRVVRARWMNNYY